MLEVIYPADFVGYLRKRAKCADDRLVMARIALNALYDPQLYPVDVFEVMRLRNESRVMTEAFLAFCAVNPQQYCSWDDGLCAELFGVVKSELGDEAVGGCSQHTQGQASTSGESRHAGGA